MLCRKPLKIEARGTLPSPSLRFGLLEHRVDVFVQRVAAGCVELRDHLCEVVHRAHAADDLVGVLRVDGFDGRELGLQVLGDDDVDVVRVVLGACLLYTSRCV